MDARVQDDIAQLLSVPEVPKEGRGRLIWSAIRLFYRYGINAVGVDRVIAEAGVSKTTFYKHFESKDELVVRALEERDAWEMRVWKEAATRLAGDSPREKLLGLVDVLEILFESEDFRGCQFINAAAEFPNPNDPVHCAAASHKLANWRWVRELAEQAGVAEPDSFADGYTLLFEGTLVLRQVHDRDDAARAARPIFYAFIDGHIPAG